MRREQASAQSGVAFWPTVALGCLAVTGLFAPRAEAQPANDNFANAQVLVGKAGMAGTVVGETFGATAEAGEPAFESTYGEMAAEVDRSIWYRWTAPADGVAVFETLKSDCDTMLSVFTGDSLGSLTLVAGNDDVNTGLGNFVHREWSTSFVEFYATAGTTYYIRVAGAPGHIVLDWSLNGEQSEDLFSGQFRFATDFLGPNNPTLDRYLTMPDGGRYPLYVFSENETAASGGYRYARLTVTRIGGAHGRVYADYEIVPLIYTNIFITNCYGSIVEVSSSAGGFTNVYTTNCVVTNIYGNATWFLPNPARRWYLTNIFAYTIIVSNVNGDVTTIVTNVPPPAQYDCENSDNPPEIIVDENTGETTIISSNVFCIQSLATTNIPSFITNAPPAADIWSPLAGRIRFDDYQMSQDIAVTLNPAPGNGPAQFYLGAEKPDAPPVNRIFQVNLTNVFVVYTNGFIYNGEEDPPESTDILPPFVAAPSGNSRLGSAIVNIMENSIAGWDGWPTNAILNLQRATWLTTEGVDEAVIWVTRSGTNRMAVSVDYRLNFRSQNRPFAENRYPCVPGSDYATHDPYTNSPYYFIATNDFIGTNGRLSWAADDFDPKEIRIRIVDDNLVEFNEDIFVELYNPLPLPTSSSPGAMLGNLGYFNLNDGLGNFANLTILFDRQYGGEQPAGAVDRFHNVDNEYFSTPPQMTNPGANGTVMALVVQPDGKTVIAGTFTSFNGTTRNRIARMLDTGYLDTGFLAPPNSGANAPINALALQSDGKLIAGGDFTTFNGQPRNRVVRLNSNGSLDTGFNPGLGANATVWGVALQADGKVVIGGEFTSVGGQPRNSIARLNSDGSLDTTFNPGTGADGIVNAVAIQADGRIVIGGEFTSVNGVARSRIARLNADGSVDTTFDPGFGANGPVYAIVIQPDGKILLGGDFTELSLRSRRGIGRLNTDGSVDMGFDPGTGTDEAVYAIALQNDGKILIGGLFRYYNETRRVGIARLYDFGALDTTFMDTAYNQFAGIPTQHHNASVEPRNFVLALGVEPSGNVMIGGYFQRVGGGFSRTDMRPRRNVARLIGGATPGPGNIQLMQDEYSVDENAGQQYVTLVRTNGDRGMINARFIAVPPPPGPGAATFTNFTLLPWFTRPFWNSSWPGDVYPRYPQDWGRIRGDCNYGPNYDPLAADFVIGNTHYFIGGSQTADVFVSINDNRSVDGDRALEFKLYRPSGADFTFLGGENIPFGAALMRRAASSTILEDDLQPETLGFSSANYVVSEGVGSALITVVRSNAMSRPVTVKFQTIAGPASATNATAVSDFAHTNGTLTFLPGQTSKSFTVPIVDDSLVEFDERIYLQLFAPGGGATLGLSNAVITIVDNDFPGGRLNFSSPTFTTNENAGFALITVARSGGAAGTLTVQCATIPGGTATAGADYTSVTNTLVWTNGDVAPKAFYVPLLDDVLIEPDETVFLRLFNPTLNGVPTNTPLGFVTNATLTLISDDALGAVRFSTTNYLVNENGGFGYVTVVRSGGSSESISVNFTVTNGTAVAGVDFVATNGTLVFGPGELSKTFTVQILDNPMQEGARFASLLLHNASPTNGLGSPAAALLTITDDESVNEPPGQLDTVFNANAGLNGPVLALALQPDGKLVAAGEFTMANGLPRNRIARLQPNGVLDMAFSSSAPGSGANATVRALIRQTDGRLVIGGDFTQVNSVNMNRIARLNLDGSLDTGFVPGSGTDNPVYALAETFVGGARKILLGGTFTTVDSAARNFVARLNDDGTLDLAFNTGLGPNGPVYAIAVQTDGKVVIGGDFTAVQGVPRHRVARLHADGSLDLSFDPGAGANAAVRALAVQLDGRILIGGSFTNYNGTARNRIARLLPGGALDTTFDVDEGANDTVNTITLQPDTRVILGGQFTRCNGVTRHRITRLNNDGSVDPTINFGLGANNFVAATLVQPDGKIVLGGGFTEYDGTPRPYIARIYGGSVTGSGRLEFLSSTFFANENGTNALITVRRRGGTSNPPGATNVTVNVLTSDGTATNGLHYVGGVFPLAFPQGEVLTSFQIPLIDDFEINSDRTVNLTLGDITPTNSAVLGDQPSATLFIINDDAGISFSSATYSRAENAVDGLALISIVRSGSTVGAASVTFRTTTSGTATPGADFTPVITNVTFNPGETMQVVAVPILNDSDIEGDETVGLQLLGAVGAILVAPYQATLTIVDDDFGPGRITFTASSFAVAENGGVAHVTLARTNGWTGVVSVNYFTSDGTANAGLDYTAQSGTVVFNDGETNKTILIPILDDTLVEGPEFFTVTLTNATGGAVIAGDPNATVTILDNDVGFTFGAPFYTVNENGGSVTISVLRINGSNGVATVDYTTTNVTATAGSDYTAVAGRLVFADGETLKTVTVPILEDTLVEGDEVFQFRLFNPTNAVLMSSAVPVTILDNDTGFRFESATYSVGEAAGSVTLTVVRTNPNTGFVIVAYTTTNDTAVAGEDYTAVSGVLVFTNGEAVKTITVPIINDTLVEGDETFFVTLTNATGGAQLLGPSTAVVTIRDNDAGLRFSSATYSISESGVQATITVLRSVITNTSVAVNYTTADGTATAGSDYVPTSGTLTFAPGEVSRTFTVQIIDDTVIEGDETVLLRLTNPAGEASLLNPNAATLTIVDNDGSLIEPAGSALTSESGPVNGALDPGETVSLLIALRNVVGAPTTNLVATLLATNGVTAPSGPQNYGALLPGGPSVSRPFTFTATGTNGGTVSATFALHDGAADLGVAIFNYQIGTRTVTFSNIAPITINDATNATPYPSTISISGVGGSIAKLTVTLSNLVHGFPDDVDVLLVGPSGQNVMLMSDCGGGNFITNVTLTFDDAAASFLPDSDLIVSGTNKPTNYLLTDVFPAPAPAPPYGSVLAAFNGSNPNGLWSLYVVDDSPFDNGSIARGWALTITTTGLIPPATDVSVKLTASPEPVIVTSNLIYTIVVTNHGPSAATNVRITNALPATVQFLSASASQGSVSTNGGVVVWSVGSLAKDAFATATIVVRPTVTGMITNTVSGFGAESDPNGGNNTASGVTTVQPVTADLALGIVTTPAGPVPLGQNLTYTLFITNLGPATATGVTLTNTLPPGVMFQSATPPAFVLSGSVVGFTNLGNLGSGAITNASITVQVLTGGTLTNSAVCASAVTDPLKANNTAIVKTEVQVPLVLFATVSGSNIEIAWPAAAANVTLERATNLTPPIVWTAVTNVPLVVGDKKIVTLPIGSGNEFFRLRPAP